MYSIQTLMAFIVVPPMSTSRRELISVSIMSAGLVSSSSGISRLLPVKILYTT